MIKTPSSTVIGGAGIWTPNTMIVGSINQNLSSLIKSLFRNNEQGFAYDPNDLSTMFQDVAGTIPVTGVGQPVGLILDKSGRNNHAFQTISASRPILQRNATTGAYYLAFDGVDDFLQTNNINFTTTDKISLFAGVRKLSEGVTQIVLESSANLNDSTGAFHLALPQPSGGVQLTSKGTANSLNASTKYAAPIALTISGFMQITTDINILNINNIKFISASDQGMGNYGNHQLYIGRRGGTSLPFNGHIYSLIGISRLTTDVETLALEKAIAKATGVTLNV